MSKKDKLISRLLQRPKDFTFNEMVSLLGYLGYELNQVIEKLRKDGLL